MILICIFALFFIVGCEDAAVKVKAKESEPKSLSIQQEIKETIVLKAKADKAFVKKKVIKTLSKKKPNLNYKYKKAPITPIAETTAVLEEQIVEKRVLDLTLPVAMTQSIHNSDISTRPVQRMLPDLFSDRESQKKQTMSVVGKILKRGEKEEEKSQIADGAGISFSLSP